MVKKIKILLLCAGDAQYHDLKNSGLFLKDFFNTSGFNTVLSSDLNMLLPENIKNFDAVVFYTVDANLSKKQTDSLLNAISGASSNKTGAPKGFVGIHGATVTIRESYKYTKMIGASFLTHPEFGESYSFKIKDKKHSITRKIKDFVLQDELYLFDIYSEFKTLISCDYNGFERPVAWLKPYGQGRIFYISLGHSIEQLKNETLQNIIINGVMWTTS